MGQTKKNKPRTLGALARAYADEQNYPSDETPIGGSAITRKESQLYDEAQQDSDARKALGDETLGPKQERAMAFRRATRGVSRKDAADVDLPIEGSVYDTPGTGTLLSLLRKKKNKKGGR
jgi:hypothetical protein